MKVRFAVLAAVAGVALAGSVQAAPVAFSDNFDSYTADSYLNGQGGWTDTGGATNYQFKAAGGAGGTQGINNTPAGSFQGNWTAHQWNWGTDVGVGDKVVMRMDFQANGTGGFDDDRVGWVLASNAGSSSYHFGVQLDNPDGGLKTYFRDNSGTRVGPIISPATTSVGDTLISLATLGATGSNWYRQQLTVTKLTSALGAAGASVDVSFQALDGSGNPVGSPLTASYGGNIDTSALRGFSGNVYPMFKNFNATTGNADNAYFEIVAVPEPTTLSLLGLAALPLIRRRRA